MAQEAWRAYLGLALGATEATRKKATKAVKRMAGKSAVTAEQLQTMAEDLLKTSAANREALRSLVRFELDRALGAVGLATADEVSALNSRVRELEAKLRQDKPAPADAAELVAATSTPAPLAKKSTPRKTVAKKAVARKTAPSGAVATIAPATSTPAAVVAQTHDGNGARPVKKTTARKAAPRKTAAASKTVAKRTVKKA
jgi:polyhydroxyalkanoate synthesis regulator phasin